MHEAWGGYMPEINSGRWEAGTGPETWATAAEVWTNFAEIVLTAGTALVGEIALMTGTTLTGITAVSMMASSVPFFGWLAEMEATALMHAAACATVAESWATASAGIIPLPMVNQNRITEANLEATNFFGINTPAIAELDREYGQFWAQDASSMMSYDSAVTLATTPKMVSPPPPLTNLAQGAAQSASQLGQAASNAAQNAQSLSNVPEQMTQAASQGANQSGDMSSVMSTMTQAAQAPMQALSSVGQNNPLTSLGQQAQSFMGPLQSMFGQFMGGPQQGAGLGSAFSGAGLTSTGGLPISTSGGGSGVGLGSGFSGAPGAMGSMGSTSDRSVKPVTNLSGVPGPSMGSGNQVGARNAMMGGGGAGGMGGAGRGGQEGSRKQENVVAADVRDDYDEDWRRESRKLFA